MEALARTISLVRNSSRSLVLMCKRPAFDRLPIYLLIGLVGAIPVTAELISGWNGGESFFDDAFYYLVTARNFIEHGRFSFDGVNETNGFHPLWMMLIALTYAIIGAAASIPVQIFATKILEASFFAATLIACSVFAYRLKKERDSRFFGFVGITLLLLYPKSCDELFMRGLETTLAAFLLVLLIYAVIQKHGRAISILLPLLFLARLDTLVFVVAPVLLVSFLSLSEERPLAGRLRIALQLGTPLAIVVTTYLGYNYAHFGHLTPISGTLKSSFPVPTLHLSFLVDEAVHRYGE